MLQFTKGNTEEQQYFTRSRFLERCRSTNQLRSVALAGSTVIEQTAAECQTLSMARSPENTGT